MDLDRETSSTRLNALLVDSDADRTTDESLGLEKALGAHGCKVRRVSTHEAARGALHHDLDVVVIAADSFADDEVLALVEHAAARARTLVATERVELAAKAAKLGATTAPWRGIDAAAAHIGRLVAVLDVERRKGADDAPESEKAPTSSVVLRADHEGVAADDATLVAKEAATVVALEALLSAAEGLVSMHAFQRVYVDYALRRCGGNKVHTAATLGIDRRTIQRWARARAPEDARARAPEDARARAVA